jgi:hypothetical protein
VVVYVDADLGEDLEKQNSTPCIIGFPRGGPFLFLWASRKQMTTASTTNCGFLAMTEAAKGAV